MLMSKCSGDDDWYIYTFNNKGKHHNFQLCTVEICAKPQLIVYVACIHQLSDTQMLFLTIYCT